MVEFFLQIPPLKGGYRMSVDSSAVGTQRCLYRTATSVVRTQNLKFARKSAINILNQWKKNVLVVHDCKLKIL